MKQHRHGLPSLFLAFACSLAGCEPPPSEPSSDSHTNWLRICSSDHDCPGLSCECGVCTLPCAEQRECERAPGAACLAADAASTVALCGGTRATAPGLCLPRCSADEACATGQACVAGACQPLAAPSARVAVDTSTVLGTLTGFGAALGYAEDELAVASRDHALAELMFAELGLDVLRLRNRYGDTAADGLAAAGEVVAAAGRSLGRAPLLMLSSWSPPAELKRNGKAFCSGESASCTLRSLPDGSYDYAGFASYWRDSLAAYARAGVLPDYIGIQNNPDWLPPPGSLFEACRFSPSEDALYPGYDRAFEAVQQALTDLPQRPRIAAPELSGAHGTEQYLERLDLSRVHAIAHHLYGQDPERLDLDRLAALRQLERSTALPLFQSEMQSDGYGTALLVHHALVTAGASMYLQTALASPRSGPLANPFALLGFEDGQLTPQDPYHAIRHFARFTDTGFRRVATNATQPELLSSAWTSPDDTALVVVLLNTGSTQQVVAVDLFDAELSLRQVVRSVFTGSERFASLAAAELSGSLALPPRSIATLRYER